MNTFDDIIPRRGTGCVKWDECSDAEVLPLWVADMDFAVAPCIQHAIRKRAEHPVFGYTKVSEDYYNAVINWFGNRHGWTIKRDSILYTIGVVPAISCCLQAITLPGQRVLISTPVYNCFFSSVCNSGCQIAENPLRRRSDGYYEFDFDDFERQCADEKTVAYVLCNPHNPVGRVWRRDELQRIVDICARHHVFVISDEIHNELVMPGYKYTPFATVNTEGLRYCVCISASKSFNIAGLQMANIVCEDPQMRQRIDRVININEVCDVNPFAPVATIAAYSDDGAEWIDSLNQYMYNNYLTIKEILAPYSDAVTLLPLEGTYLAWLDCTPLCSRMNINSEQLADALVSEAKVFFTAGSHYGSPGEDFLRINMACPQSILREALTRFTGWMKKYFFSLNSTADAIIKK